jgi:ABC-type lipoprotein export system ATPase subunit
VLETLANLVHAQSSAGILVTHDLRLVPFSNRVIQMLDGRFARSIFPQDDLSCLAEPAECQLITPEALGYARTV